MVKSEPDLFFLFYLSSEICQRQSRHTSLHWCEDNGQMLAEYVSAEVGEGAIVGAGIGAR